MTSRARRRSLFRRAAGWDQSCCRSIRTGFIYSSKYFEMGNSKSSRGGRRGASGVHEHSERYREAERRAAERRRAAPAPGARASSSIGVVEAHARGDFVGRHPPCTHGSRDCRVCVPLDLAAVAQHERARERERAAAFRRRMEEERAREEARAHRAAQRARTRREHRVRKPRRHVVDDAMGELEEEADDWEAAGGAGGLFGGARGGGE